MTKFIMIGYGWRADFFYRIAEELPEEFKITGAVLRTKERANQVAKERNVFATSDLQKALDTKPDYAVLCVPRAIVKDYLEVLMEKDIPVLCETPPGKSVEELQELWQLKEKYNGRIQIIEQYFLQPLYAGILDIIQAGKLGDIQSMTLSALHGYHAVSVFRKILGVSYENCRIAGQKFEQKVTVTNSRAGFDYSGKVIGESRELITLQFENGKTAVFDFSSEHYFSQIRTRRLNVQGIRGEINDMTVRYLNEKNIPVTGELNRMDLGVYNNSSWSHHGIMFEDRFVYQNPFPEARLNDDEIAVADCMRRMKRYTEDGTEFYTLREALQDTYLSFAMEEAVAKGETIDTQSQIWG